jgi:hypothetical protein
MDFCLFHLPSWIIAQRNGYIRVVFLCGCYDFAEGFILMRLLSLTIKFPHGQEGIFFLQLIDLSRIKLANHGRAGEHKKRTVGLADGGSAFFLLCFAGGVMMAAKIAENPLNLTKSKRSRIGFKAGIICGEWCCTGMFGPVFYIFFSKMLGCGRTI